MPIRKAPRCVQHRRGLIEGGECNASLLPNSEGIVALSESRVNSKTHNLKKKEHRWTADAPEPEGISCKR